ncbi:MAG: S24/S26 family peptidase [Acidaminococcaceae bacterium]|nr:S24/S26 family peptidase [Acidaminococcaceae bacterium]
MNNSSVADNCHAQISLADYLPVIETSLKNGGSVRLTITGTSMVPTIRGGRDQVTLCAVAGPLKKYDLPLYRRENGQFILHRIVRVDKEGAYVCCGDHQWVREPGIRPDQIIAVVSEICRKGKTFSVRNIRYRLWSRLWVWLLPVRKYLFRIYQLLSRSISPKKGKKIN